MTDYPDWQRAFRIVGVDVTIPINIAASAVTLSVAIASAAVTLDVNIAAAAVDLNIVFTDQSVAVFDANQWYALQAQQIFVLGSGNVANNSNAVLASRTVPAGYVFFITGMAYAVRDIGAPPTHMYGELQIAASAVVELGSAVGHGIIFDTPLRATAGQVVQMVVAQYGSGGTRNCAASFWGYDRAV